MRAFRFCLFLFVCFLGGVAGCLCCYLCMSLTIFLIYFFCLFFCCFGGVAGCACLLCLFVWFVKKACLFVKKLIQCEKYNSV